MMNMTRVLTHLAAVVAVACWPGLAPAQSGHGSDVVSVQLIPGWRTDTGTHMTALRIRLAPGWKTYWRAPGEAGLPPVIDWDKSRNLADALIRFPQPEVYEKNGFRTIGYSREVVLPIELTPEDGDAAIVIDSVLEIGVCEDICMPTVMRIKATLPRSGHQSPEIMQALASEPRRIAAQPACQLSLISDGVRLTARLPRLSMITGSMVAIAEVSDPRVWVSETTLSRDGRQVVATVDFVPPHGAALVFDRSRLRMTVLGLPGEAIEMMGCAD